VSPYILLFIKKHKNVIRYPGLDSRGITRNRSTAHHPERQHYTKDIKTTSTEMIQLCQTYLCFELPSVLLKKELKNLEKEVH